MTDTPRDASEIADYRLAVERHLADLPTPIREDLLADLETHLTEIAAELESGATLADRLGSPEDYARELRETAGVTGRIERPRGGFRVLADRYTTSAGVGGFAEFGRSLRPGWWVLRGVLCAVVVFAVIGVAFSGSSMPLLRDIVQFWPLTVIAFAASALTFVWLSLRLGAKSAHQGFRYRGIVAVSGFALAAIVLWGAASLVGGYWSDEFGNDWGGSDPFSEMETEGYPTWPDGMTTSIEQTAPEMPDDEMTTEAEAFETPMPEEPSTDEQVTETEVFETTTASPSADEEQATG
ncbi:DUF1700 domain-containing protein [Glycomyces tenuis]|uniref:DUF1700 domain-containing protein n=1 Tax=Glycomyces tenuis TaxID=58116 RepID=UPI00041F6B86|nr:hypothetical protein [Glycomyces tenuis]